jgi:hypothetical protein
VTSYYLDSDKGLIKWRADLYLIADLFRIGGRLAIAFLLSIVHQFLSDGRALIGVQLQIVCQYFHSYGRAPWKYLHKC